MNEWRGTMDDENSGAAQPGADEMRAAVAALLRIGEPGDGLLRAAVEAVGADAMVENVRAVADRHITAAQAAAAIREREPSLPGAGQLIDAFARWAVRAGDSDGRRDLDSMIRLGARLVMPGDVEWPGMLDDLGPATPLGLWVRGPARLDGSVASAVAIVGARAASNYGAKCASDLAWDLAATGITVVSGGAFGIDAAAHRAVLARGGTTLAFMAGGVDRFYPSANSDLFRAIVDSGAIVSETAPGMTPMRHRFLLRNRLIAAVSCATVVVEAGWRSGALNTARHALELSREVAAMPGSVHSSTSQGCHRLIRDHEAELVTGADDVIALMAVDEPALFDLAGGPSSQPNAQPADTVVDGLDEREKICFNALSTTRANDPGAIAGLAGLSIRDVLSTLAGLELKGLSARRGAGWVKVRRT